MQLRELYRDLITRKGEDVFTRALGRANARLAQNPGDVYARLYKGAMLTMVDEDVVTAEKKQEYIQIGAELIIETIEDFRRLPDQETEMRYVAATTLASLPDELGFANTAQAQLELLLDAPDLDELTQFEIVRALTLDACFAESANDTKRSRQQFSAASALDRDLAIETYEHLRR